MFGNGEVARSRSEECLVMVKLQGRGQKPGQSQSIGNGVVTRSRAEVTVPPILQFVSGCTNSYGAGLVLVE